jgi:cytochrome c peroxidase
MRSARLFLFSISFILIIFISMKLISADNVKYIHSTEDLFTKYLLSNSNLVLNELNKIGSKSEINTPTPPDSARFYLGQARLAYKSIEAFIIYFFPGDARLINRPIIAEMAEDDEITPYVEPHGFQYLEQLLYSDSAFYFRKKIIREADQIYKLLSDIQAHVSTMEFSNRDLFEAMQLHLVRQFVLGLANFETASSRRGVEESKALLIAYKKFLLEVFPTAESRNPAADEKFYEAINRAVEYLHGVKPGAEPDYYAFYSQYYIPVSEYLGAFRDHAVTENSYATTAINFQARSIFDPHAFNTNFFLPARRLADKTLVVDLGKTLFFDPALSANNLRACASCHQPGKAFTDGLPQSQAFEPGKFLTRNAPTILNAVLQRKLFHDGRAYTFEDQAGQVMSNALEMHNDFSQVALKLRKSPEYVSRFRSAFTGTEDTIINNRSILTALAEYERSLIGLNSRFDKAISGREDLLSADEKTGFNLFMGKGNCGSCHFIPLFNGLMPPNYVETEWEILGVPSLKRTGKPEIDEDPGRGGIIDVPIFRHAFKVPTLRNVELTAPYMHNGVFRTLEEVVEFYDTGGGTSLGYDVPFQTLSSDSLHLSPTEKFQLVSFLKSLTDTAYLTSRPARLPAFPEDDKLSNRPVGGDY